MSQSRLIFAALIYCIPPCNSWAYDRMQVARHSTLPNIIGTWGLSTTSYVEVHRTSKTDVTTKTVTVHCNTCPEIIFKTDGTGCIKSENGHEFLSNFKWTITGARLVFVNDKTVKKVGITLANGNYKIIPHADVAGFPAIELVDLKNTRQLLIKSN